MLMIIERRERLRWQEAWVWQLTDLLQLYDVSRTSHNASVVAFLENRPALSVVCSRSKVQKVGGKVQFGLLFLFIQLFFKRVVPYCFTFSNNWKCMALSDGHTFELTIGWVASRPPRTRAVLQSNIGLPVDRSQRLYMEGQYAFHMNIRVAWGCWNCSPFWMSGQFWNWPDRHGSFLNAGY